VVIKWYGHCIWYKRLGVVLNFYSAILHMPAHTYNCNYEYGLHFVCEYLSTQIWLGLRKQKQTQTLPYHILDHICDWICENRSYRPWQDRSLILSHKYKAWWMHYQTTDSQSKGICFSSCFLQALWRAVRAVCGLDRALANQEMAVCGCTAPWC